MIMKYLTFIFYLVCALECHGQQSSLAQANKTVIEFLRWHKSGASFKYPSRDFITKYYGKGG
jgi:hypothetical protein